MFQASGNGLSSREGFFFSSLVALIALIEKSKTLPTHCECWLKDIERPCTSHCNGKGVLDLPFTFIFCSPFSSFQILVEILQKEAVGSNNIPKRNKTKKNNTKLFWNNQNGSKRIKTDQNGAGHGSGHMAVPSFAELCSGCFLALIPCLRHVRAGGALLEQALSSLEKCQEKRGKKFKKGSPDLSGLGA